MHRISIYDLTTYEGQRTPIVETTGHVEFRQGTDSWWPEGDFRVFTDGDERDQSGDRCYKLFMSLQIPNLITNSFPQITTITGFCTSLGYSEEPQVYREAEDENDRVWYHYTPIRRSEWKPSPVMIKLWEL